MSLNVGIFHDMFRCTFYHFLRPEVQSRHSTIVLKYICEVLYECIFILCML